MTDEEMMALRQSIMPEERLTAIEKQIGERVRELLSIPSRRNTERQNKKTNRQDNT